MFNFKFYKNGSLNCSVKCLVNSFNLCCCCCPLIDNAETFMKIYKNARHIQTRLYNFSPKKFAP